jgi:hypothetical protein
MAQSQIEHPELQLDSAASLQLACSSIFVADGKLLRRVER